MDDATLGRMRRYIGNRGGSVNWGKFTTAFRGSTKAALKHVFDIVADTKPNCLRICLRGTSVYKRSRSKSSTNGHVPRGVRPKSAARPVVQLLCDSLGPNKRSIPISSHPSQHAGPPTCTFWLAGHCTKGASCNFDHCANKAPTCRFYSAGTCIKGTSCRYAHNLVSVESASGCSPVGFRASLFPVFFTVFSETNVGFWLAPVLHQPKVPNRGVQRRVQLVCGRAWLLSLLQGRGRCPQLVLHIWSIPQAETKVAAVACSSHCPTIQDMVHIVRRA